ncbi:MAG: YhbY family RNA-binding protein [Clostridia bacterium]|nr:YhbY family RNA-binding protein [Clostridia bacterium]
MTSKQRSILRSLAQNVEPIGQIGKGGVSENALKSFSDALDARELIKITVLKNSDEEVGVLCDSLAEKLGAEAVCAIGRKVVLYRRSGRKDVKHIEF